MSLANWKNIMAGTPAYLIGNGPTLADVDYTQMRKVFSIGINRCMPPYLGSFSPTILFWQDAEFTKLERARINACPSLKICRCEADRPCNYLHYVKRSAPYKITDSPAMLYGQRASTSVLAYQFAHSLGCNPIVLLGMDCCYRRGRTDHYGINKSHHAQTLERCADALDWILAAEDRTVINCGARNPQRLLDLSKALAATPAVDQNELRGDLLLAYAGKIENGSSENAQAVL